jgi:hypothetical protein
MSEEAYITLNKKKYTMKDLPEGEGQRLFLKLQLANQKKAKAIDALESAQWEINHGCFLIGEEIKKIKEGANKEKVKSNK